MVEEVPGDPEGGASGGHGRGRGGACGVDAGRGPEESGSVDGDEHEDSGGRDPERGTRRPALGQGTFFFFFLAFFIFPFFPAPLASTILPSRDGSSNAPTQVWNKHQRKLPKKDRTTVIYGHDSKRGLQLKKYSMGLDTGCLKGGKLTAVVIEGGNSAPKHRVVHVKCKDGRKH